MSHSHCVKWSLANFVLKNGQAHNKLFSLLWLRANMLQIMQLCKHSSPAMVKACFGPAPGEAEARGKQTREDQSHKVYF